MTKSNKPNRLINETSPYLLQHAYNPVDWFPWGNEAFAKAKTEDKPVFLSIGYSTCHWCHVMEEESFEDIQVAEYLNAHFVSVKVDKEERPDVDAVYMTVCQALTGSGGWPTTILMTHEQKPFFAGTYFPKHSRWGHTGLLELLDAVKQKWDTERKDLLESCDKISQALNDNRITRKSETVADGHVVEKAINTLTKSFDKQYGGFGRAPKFPMPHNLMFLLRCHLLGISDDALPMTKKTLEAMYRGGIFDHIGGGFSRYSTDNKWLAPHFEKMLYDNALMTIALTECYTLTKNEFYGAIVKKVLAYVTNEMTSKEGGFFSAQDADIGGEEGKYYTFTSDEIIKTLGDENAKYLCGLYDITENGNFEGKNILNLIAQDTATLPDAKTQDMLDVLYEYRKLRYRLHTDDKILTSWNALMIAAFARAGRVFGCEKYIDTAINALNFLYENLADGNGRIFISYRSGKAKGEGLLDDYAFLAWACLELYDAAFEVSYLEKACNLAAIILSDFSDAQGGFYLSPVNGERLLLRTKEQYDGATPSGNSVAAYVLTRLAALTAQRKWLDAAERQLRFYGDMFEIQPTACVFALLALVRKVYPAHELVCVLSRESDIWPLSKQIHEFVPPQTEIIIKTPENSERLAKLAPFTKEYAVPDGKRCAFYLCSGGTCRTPVYDIQELTNIFSL